MEINRECFSSLWLLAFLAQTDFEVLPTLPGVSKAPLSLADFLCSHLFPLKCPQISVSGSEPPKIFQEFSCFPSHVLSFPGQMAALPKRWVRPPESLLEPHPSTIYGIPRYFTIFHDIPQYIYSEKIHRPERTFICLFFCLIMFYVVFDLRYSSSFIYSTPISSGSVHLSMHPSIYYLSVYYFICVCARTVAVIHHAHRCTYRRTHTHPPTTSPTQYVMHAGNDTHTHTQFST